MYIKNKKAVTLIIMIMTVILVVAVNMKVVFADDEKNAEKGSDDYIEEYLGEYDFGEVDNELKKNSDFSITYKELIQNIINGDKTSESGAMGIFNGLFTNFIKSNKAALLQIIMLAILSALINGFAPSFNKNQISDTAKIIISISLITILLASFAYSCNICADAVKNCIDMYKAIIPVFFSAVTFAQGNISSGVYYEIVLMMITVVNMIFGNILIYLQKIYVLFKMSDSVTGEEHFSKAAEIIPLIVKWTCRAALFIFSGMAGVKSLFVPMNETVKKNILIKSLQAIPGIGGSVEVVAKTIVGAGTIIKNAIGVAAIVVLLVICSIPVIKLVVLTCLYKITAAAIEPVADKKIVEAVNSISIAIGSLAQITLITVSLFVLMLGIICISTNYNYIS